MARCTPSVVGAALLLAATSARGVVIDNDLAPEELGAWSVDVASGGETAVAFLTARPLGSGESVREDVVFRYDSWVDPGADGQGFRLSLSGTEPVPDAGDPDRVTSTGSFIGANGNTIRWEVASNIDDGSVVLVNLIRLTAESGVLGPLRFLQYLDEDVAEDPNNDVFFSRGSAMDDDLELFTMDNALVYGVSHSGALSLPFGLVNARFAGWAADIYDRMRPRMAGSGQPVSVTGEVQNLLPLQHSELGTVLGPADIVSVLAWDVEPEAREAVIITTLGGVPSIRCGNGEVEPAFGEECDLGAANGLPSGCCTGGCQLRAAGDLCRGAAGVCDVEERCDGSAPTCPADAFAAAGSPCRSAAGDCDPAEACTGTSPQCPADVLAAPGTECRTAADLCDVAETCSGATPDCPANALVPAGTVCRGAQGQCDAIESCSGQDAACPADTAVSDGTTCDDGDACIDDGCVAGACVTSAACSAIDVGATPLDETLSGRRKATVLTLEVEREQSTQVEATGFATDSIAGATAARAITVAGARPPISPGTQVTKRVRRRLKGKSSRRTVLRLKLNREGRLRVASEGALQVRVVVRVTERGGVPATLHFDRLWRR